MLVVVLDVYGPLRVCMDMVTTLPWEDTTNRTRERSLVTRGINLPLPVQRPSMGQWPSDGHKQTGRYIVLAQG
jgi:hypothetical protein